MRPTTRMSPDAASSSAPKPVAPSATPFTGAWARSIALKSAFEMVLGNSIAAMSSRSRNSAQPPGAMDSTISSVFLLVVLSMVIPPPPSVFLQARAIFAAPRARVQCGPRIAGTRKRERAGLAA